MTLASLLQTAPELDAYHEPTPRLLRLSKLAHHEWRLQGEGFGFWSGVVEASRAEQVWSAHRRSRVYVETGNRLTFLAPVLARYFPASRFIILHRDPMAVVASGLRRRWFEGHPWDWARIEPDRDDPMYATWPGLPAAQKIAWLWAEVNSMALEFCRRLPSERYLVLASEDLFGGHGATIEELFEFIGVPMPRSSALKRVLSRRENASTGRDQPDSLLDDVVMESIWRIVGDVSLQLGRRAPVPIVPQSRLKQS